MTPWGFVEPPRIRLFLGPLFSPSHYSVCRDKNYNLYLIIKYVRVLWFGFFQHFIWTDLPSHQITLYAKPSSYLIQHAEAMPYGKDLRRKTRYNTGVS
jgi:hypothetical protein